MKMRAIDVLRNLESHDGNWDIAGYTLSKNESEIIIKSLKLLIAQEERQNNADTGSTEPKQDMAGQ